MSKIHLRRLEKKDAPFMLEWMTDPSIVCFFRFDFSVMTEDACIEFIEKSYKNPSTIHSAIVDAQDEYLGTISLKDINYEEKSAEYAISTRKKVHGTGIAAEATEEILRVAFNDIGLEKVFLNVIEDNVRANKFYRKVGFVYQYTEENALEIHGQMKDLNWYMIKKDNYLEHLDEE